jgi:hypothetical protein
MSDEDKRCTDEKLFQLCQDFHDHKVEEDEWRKNHDVRMERLFNAQDVNTKAITEITAAVSAVVSDTAVIVQLSKDFQGAARVGKGLQGFVVWCLKWGGILGGLGAGVHYLIEHFSKH